MKKSLLFAAAAMMAGSMFAESVPVALLPEGVTANIDQQKNFYRQRNVTVAGSPQKGYYAFFAATDAEHGSELWVTDGTPAGTRLVKDINPGVATSNVSYLTRFNDKVVFQATNEDEGAELWISDGTEDGTYMIKDIHELESSNPHAFCQMDETHFIFFARDFEAEQVGEDWVWVSDGTEEGTKCIKQVKTVYPGENYAEDDLVGPIVRVGRKVFFKADGVSENGFTYGPEVWVTDGTEEGTHMVADINWEEAKDEQGIQTGTLGCAPTQFINFYNEGLEFRGWDPDHGNEPRFSDGTEAGTYLIADVNPNVGTNGIGAGSNHTKTGDLYNGMVIMRAYYPGIGNELLATTCVKGNFLPVDVFTEPNSEEHNSFIDAGSVFDGLYMFCAATGFDKNNELHKGGELHCFDGEKVWMQYDLAPGTGCDWVKENIVVGGSLYWWNEGSLDGTGATKTKLIRLDKWDQQPVIVSNIDAAGDQVYCLRNLNGTLLFTSSVNNQLYSYYYRSEVCNLELNPDVMEPEYRTRAEIAAGVENVAASKKAVKVNVYPNPATVSFSVAGAENSKVSVYDIAGRLVLTSDKASNVSVAGLAKGVYKVIVNGEAGRQAASLIVK